VPNPCIVWKRDAGSIVTALEPEADATRFAKHGLDAVLKSSLPLQAATASATPALIARAAAMRTWVVDRVIRHSEE